LLYYKSVYKSVPIFINFMNHPVRKCTAKCKCQKVDTKSWLSSLPVSFTYLSSSPPSQSFPLRFLSSSSLLFILSLLSLLSSLFFALDRRLRCLDCVYDVLILSDKYGFPLPSAIPSRV
jgi:hypothetical protein